MKNTYKNKIFIIWALVLAFIVHTTYLRFTLSYYGEQVHAQEPEKPFDDRLGEVLDPKGDIVIMNGKSPAWGKIKEPRLSDVSAYTSRIQETDGTPCIAANGKDICKLHKQGIQTCASNDYKLGSKLKIDGLGECIVSDRMNKRYSGTGRVDFYMGMDLKGALKHGVKKLMVTEL